MAINIARREFIAALGGVAIAWPLDLRAQQAGMQIVGYLSSLSADPMTFRMPAFLQGLKETGYIEGQNMMMEYRSAEGRYDRLPSLAAELVELKVAVIFASGGSC